jgi:hypothetical protein
MENNLSKTSYDQFYENINKLSSHEISSQIRNGYYVDDAHNVAAQILKERNIEVPEVDKNYKPTSKSIFKSYYFWSIVGILGSAILKELNNKMHGY